MRTTNQSGVAGIATAFIALLAVLAFSASPASAESLAPWWSLTSGALPSELQPGPCEAFKTPHVLPACGQIVVTAQNVGDARADGEPTPVKIVDVLPEGLRVLSISAQAGGEPPGGPFNRGPVDCVVKTVTCTFAGKLPAYEQIEVRITVEVVSSASSGELNTVSVSGGGATGVKTLSRPIGVGGEPKFGIEEYTLVPENAGGSLDTQAGSHPFQVTSVLTLNQTFIEGKGYFKGEPRTPALPKDLSSELPAGFVGNPTPIEQCTQKEFETKIDHLAGFPNGCPLQSVVGVTTVTYTSTNLGLTTLTQPIFALKPLTGEPARFGFSVAGIVPVYLDASVHTGGNYAVTVGSSNIIQISWLGSFKLTFWGVPEDSRHNEQRGLECLVEGFFETGGCEPLQVVNPPAFLTMPTSCEVPFESTVRGDSWPGSEGVPADQAEPVTYRLPVSLDGCNHLPFSPSISVVPDIPDGSSSTGLSVDLHVPQEGTLNPEGLAEAGVRRTIVALPEGVAVNPAGADGLGACADLPEPGRPGGEIALQSAEPVLCPNSSKIGTITARTPLLPEPLEGSIYLASQDANPFGSLLAIYIALENKNAGVLVKLAGELKLSETGQVVTTIEQPQLPVEEAVLHFFGGERAPLGTPAYCGAYTTTSSIAPWSGSVPSTPSSTFEITSGPHGSPCDDPLPFAPYLTAGTTSIQAGGLSPFTMTMSREDGNQNLQAITLKMPPGLTGLLSGVKLCAEAQADAGTCGPESLIGETIVSVGLGSEPFSVTGGKVYITGPYDGAPFGLSIVNPAKAGPLNLGEVIVRAKIEVNPTTAELTITTDNSGPYKIPQFIDGIPLQIKHVNVTINRPSFTLNPTNCDPLAVTGTLDSAEGQSSPVSVPFQVTNCAALKFTPRFEVSTSGKTNKSEGASLTAKVSYPPNAVGTQAWLKSVRVELPKALPSRLTTLQKACTAKAFETNPASCPAESVIGHAIVHTEVLPVPLEGPAYFVSHGGEAFPNLEIVLQGYGVTFELVGDTDISNNGITSSTFPSTPDVPFETFELNLPQGKYSALAANGNLCQQDLIMPTAFVGQNGATLNQDTHIEVKGCSSALSVVSANVHKRTVVLVVYVPGAGKLAVSGKGVGKASKTAAGREEVKVKLHGSKGGKAKIKLSFSPRSGKHQTKTITVKLGK